MNYMSSFVGAICSEVCGTGRCRGQYVMLIYADREYLRSIYLARFTYTFLLVETTLFQKK